MTQTLLKSGFIALMASLATAPALAEPLTAEAIAKQANVDGLSMSLEGDMLVGVVANPNDPDSLAAAYWDLSGDIDTSKPLTPTSITPSNKRMKFVGASALKQKMSLWGANQAYTGSMGDCGETTVGTGATKTFIRKTFLGNEKITDIDDMPNGPKEVGINKDLQRCMELNNVTRLESILPLEPSKVIITRFSPKSGTHYFKYDLATGKDKFLYSDNGSIVIDEINNRDGMPISKYKGTYKGGVYYDTYYLIDPKTNKFTLEEPLSANIEERNDVTVLARDENDGSYFIATDKFSDKVAIYKYNPSSDEFSDEPVFAHPEFSARGVITSSRKEDFGQVLGFTYAGAETETYWVDPEMKSIQGGLDGLFPGKHVSMLDRTADNNRILIEVSSATTPPAFYLLIDKSKLAVIGSSRPWIDPAQLSETELVYYTARDGLKIPAYLTEPKGLKPGEKARGAIILPHGGPWARDYGGWDSTGWNQFLTTRGFIVLQPNYRGSQGFGRELHLAGDNEWGQKMQDDKDDAAAWLVASGKVDADKLAIFGYSYGGFAAMAATVRPNSPFQCAIAGAGVSNLAKVRNNWGRNKRQRKRQAQTLTGMDPMDNTEKANIPILVYHGDRDVRVPLFHGTEFYKAVKKYQPDSRLVVVKDMPHSMPWWPTHHRESLNAIEDFLSTTCGL